MKTSLLARTGAAIVGVGFVVFFIGIFPDVFHLDETPGFGLLQIITFLFGITLLTWGASMYMYATRHRTHTPRLREDVGVRLMATGVVIAYVAGLADILGIGSHFGAERPLFGPFQAYGVVGGVLIILIGIAMYASPRR